MSRVLSSGGAGGSFPPKILQLPSQNFKPPPCVLFCIDLWGYSFPLKQKFLDRTLVSFVERFIILCPYLRVSNIGGFTVHLCMHSTCTYKILIFVLTFGNNFVQPCFHSNVYLFMYMYNVGVVHIIVLVVYFHFIHRIVCVFVYWIHNRVLMNAKTE